VATALLTLIASRAPIGQTISRWRKSGLLRVGAFTCKANQVTAQWQASLLPSEFQAYGVVHRERREVVALPFEEVEENGKGPDAKSGLVASNEPILLGLRTCFAITLPASMS
jgi:hypothetical protein